MAQITIHAAKTNLSKLIARAQAGEEIVILNGKTPVARLTAIRPPVKRQFGAYQGEFTVPDSFFDPLPEEELAAWEGNCVGDYARAISKDNHGDPLGHPRPAVVDERQSKTDTSGSRPDRKRR